MYPHGNITKSEDLSKYADNLANLVAIQKGYIKWFELQDKVNEQDATIRSNYQKKTIKTYDASFKTLKKSVSKVPHISDQATADAECAPLEQIYNEQVQFMNSTTPDAKK